MFILVFAAGTVVFSMSTREENINSLFFQYIVYEKNKKFFLSSKHITLYKKIHSIMCIAVANI